MAYAYNTDNHLAWLVLGRSSLEYAAVTYYYAKRFKQLRISGPDFEIGQLKAFEDLMLQYSHGTRFDWVASMAGNRDRLREKFSPPAASRAVNVMTALSHLAQRDERYRDVVIAYEMLSDFAHPNMASHVAVAQMQDVPSSRYETRLAVRPGALRGEFLMVVSLPWVSTGLGTTVELLIETVPLLETWLGYVDSGARVRIDMTK